MDETGERKMFQGEWSCSGCGKAITQLPFEPRNTDGLKCLDCFKESAPARAAGGGQRTMHSGDWKCSGCGAAITELPFEPRETNNLTCRDCFIKSRQ
jgi:CxxC-x17-CxxC domain-containing protein